ncbi:MAG: AraC family transcriptional regulator [Cyanobacteria bacterium J06638_22]
MQTNELPSDPIHALSSPSRTASPWEPVRVQRLQNPPGEGSYHCAGSHTLFMALAPRPIYYSQTQDGKIHTGLHRQGDLLITPANMPLLTQWKGNEDCLQIQLTTGWLQTVAQETLGQDSDRLQLLPSFQVRDSQLEAIATMLFTEFQQNPAGTHLYVESLANILAVHLLRQHATTQPRLALFEGGIPQRQLVQVLDYMEAHLDQAIKLADLAQLLDMSQFHFSHVFKQSMGLSPYQYLLQQRMERAKQLLKQTDQRVIDIALECGFASHSHFSKQFRQVTGLTPKAYRAT